MAHVVTIGGGTGTFVVLSALKKLPDISLSAIVTTADDGGSTGRLRDAYGFLPMGDARQALVALSPDGTTLRDLFAYRFQKGDVTGHNLGNLFLTALTNLLGSEAAAIKEASRILRVKGYVIPATDQAGTLVARLSDGTTIEGESTIQERDPACGTIQSLSFKESMPLRDEAAAALGTADAIVLGPGNLYASTIAALLPWGTKEVVATSPARLIYIVNLFTRRGQTDGCSASRHIAEITNYVGRAPDRVIIHAGVFSEEVLNAYAKAGEYPVTDDLSQDDRSIIRATVASAQIAAPLPGDSVRRSLIRHDPELLSAVLAPLVA